MQYFNYALQTSSRFLTSTTSTEKVPTTASPQSSSTKTLKPVKSQQFIQESHNLASTSKQGILQSVNTNQEDILNANIELSKQASPSDLDPTPTPSP